MAFKSIQVVSAKVTGTHTRFPVLVQPSAISGIGALTLAQMQSMRVYSDEAKTTELAREIVGSDEMWVSVTSLTNTTTIYLDYDGVRSDYAVGATYGRNNVWSDYDAVFHLKDGSGLVATNSTGGTDGVLSASGIWNTDAPFGEAKGILADGSGYISTGISGTISNYTMSSWSYVDNTATNHNQQGQAYSYISGTRQMISQYYDDGNSVSQRDAAREYRNNSQCAVYSPELLDQWYHRVITSQKNTSSGFKSYRNGASLGTATPSNNDVVLSTRDIVLSGRNINGTKSASAEHLRMSEWRFGSNILSANWVATEYNNQSDNGSFWGTATDLDGGGGGDPVQNSSFLTIF